MAILESNDSGWWRYAVEFARRGLWPLGDIETHGPHEYPADRIWGEALCAAHDKSVWNVLFSGPGGCRHYSDIRGLRMIAEEDEEIRFPIIPASQRNHRAQKWLLYARKQCQKF